MTTKRFLFSALLFAFSLMAEAKVVKGFTSTQNQSSGYITFKVESVDYRDDLTRVYARLQGRPHTSERIDELVIILPSGRSYKSTDIDGVDMKRWFQWEDNGNIEVEIDFPVIAESNSFSIKSSGPKGISQTNIRKTGK